MATVDPAAPVAPAEGLDGLGARAEAESGSCHREVNRKTTAEREPDPADGALPEHPARRTVALFVTR
ncbi:hypothetical protein OHA04_04205 [Streptomyces sp. NBC_01590]|uniref:hypothetical protein n=1 Tax=Streptomyces sp. NBC_01590 TaxID=2975887 RepID=UPI003862FEA3